MSMSPDEVQNFWVRAKSLKTGSEVMSLYQMTAQKKVHSDSQSFVESGTFLPLSVWATKGFSTENIAARSRPENIREDEVINFAANELKSNVIVVCKWTCVLFAWSRKLLVSVIAIPIFSTNNLQTSASTIGNDTFMYNS